MLAAIDLDDRGQVVAKRKHQPIHVSQHAPVAPHHRKKRPNDLVVSYGHADRESVDPLVDWLKHYVGLDRS